jgi:predicted SAM-dependent methyltransferase
MISEIKKLVRDKSPFLFSDIRASVILVRHHVWHQLSQRHIRRMLIERNEIFVELGAGDKKGEGGWVTVDIVKNCDIFWDLRKGLPFPDESITKIYSSHFFEHLSFGEGHQLLDECRRVLIPGGTFSICVPNARLYIEAYLRSDSLDENRFFDHKPAYNNTTRIDYVNYVAYMGGHHKYMFDEENLLYVLTSRGFRNAHLRQFDPSLDLKVRDFESIYAEAEK